LTLIEHFFDPNRPLLTTFEHFLITMEIPCFEPTKEVLLKHI